MALKTWLLWVRSVRVGGLGQVGIGLQGFVKHLHLPAFFVGRGNSVIVASQVTASQMQDSRAVVFVFKDLAETTRTSFVYPLNQPRTGVCSEKISSSTRVKRLFFLSSSLKASSRLSLSAAMKCRSLLVITVKFSSEENQLSISTKRNFKALPIRVSTQYCSVKDFLVGATRPAKVLARPARDGQVNGLMQLQPTLMAGKGCASSLNHPGIAARATLSDFERARALQ